MAAKSYAGIGARKTPREVMGLMAEVARRLDRMGYTLRSGAAEGADMAFESGATRKEIYLPWSHFNGHPSPFCKPSPEAFEIAKALHPAWSRLSPSARKLQARNSHQILGLDLQSPCDFVLCWTPDGCEHESERTALTGGTGQAIALASRHEIPVFNIAREHAFERLAEFLRQSKQPSQSYSIG